MPDPDPAAARQFSEEENDEDFARVVVEGPRELEDLPQPRTDVTPAVERTKCPNCLGTGNEIGTGDICFVCLGDEEGNPDALLAARDADPVSEKASDDLVGECVLDLRTLPHDLRADAGDDRAAWIKRFNFLAGWLRERDATIAVLTRAITGGDASAWDIEAIARLAEHQRCVSSLELPETR